MDIDIEIRDLRIPQENRRIPPERQPSPVNILDVLKNRNNTRPTVDKYVLHILPCPEASED